MQLDMMKLDMEISKNVENGNFRNQDLNNMLNLKQFQDVVNSRILRILLLRKNLTSRSAGLVVFPYNTMEMGIVQNQLKKLEQIGNFEIQELTTSRISILNRSVPSDFPNLAIFKIISSCIAANQASF